jgi:hypothetical protein
MRMIDFSTAFPKRTPIEPYLKIVESASTAALGDDKMPRVILEEFSTHSDAEKAANVIRNYSQNHKMNLRVNCPENDKVIYVYKGKPRVMKKEKTDASEKSQSDISKS